MGSVKKHKRVRKNGVSIVRKHLRKSGKGHGIKYDPTQFAPSKKKKKPRFTSASSGVSKFLFEEQARAAHARGKAGMKPTYVKGKRLPSKPTSKPKSKPKPKKKIPKKVPHKPTPTVVPSVKSKPKISAARQRGRNLAARLFGRKPKRK